MTLPYNLTERIWLNQAASDTKTYTNQSGTIEPQKSGQLKLVIQPTNFSGTLDFQTSADGAAWFNLPHYRSDVVPFTIGVAQENLVLDSAGREYVIPGGPFPRFRIVMTLTAGTITAELSCYEHDNGLNVLAY